MEFLEAAQGVLSDIFGSDAASRRSAFLRKTRGLTGFAGFVVVMVMMCALHATLAGDTLGSEARCA